MKMGIRDIATLERAVMDARRRRDDAAQALRSVHERDAVDAWRAAHTRLKRLERELGLAKGDEVALPIAWEHEWVAEDAMSHVVAAGRNVYLMYRRLLDLEDGTTSAAPPDPASSQPLPLAFARVEGCYLHRFGGPDDEAHTGHPLADRGFDGQGAYTVANSRWIATHHATERVHPRYDPSRWESRRHYMLVFPDEIFECIATGFVVEVRDAPLAEAIGEIAARAIYSGR